MGLRVFGLKNHEDKKDYSYTSLRTEMNQSQVLCFRETQSDRA